MNLRKNRRLYTEILIALVVIAGLWLAYRYEQNNFENYLAEKFPSQGLSLGQVVSIQNETSTDAAYQTQDILVTFLTGDNKGQTTTVLDRLISTSTKNDYLRLSPGEKILLARNTDFTNPEFYIADRYRLPSLLLIILVFIGVAVLFGRLRGFTSIIGLAMSVGILGWFVIPQILKGHDPLWACLEGAAMIALVSLYLAHGFNKRTTVALLGTLITLAVSALLAILFVSLTKLIGLTTDESFYVSIGTNVDLNLRGLLLGGIIIGALGLLDDVTIGQANTVAELKAAAPHFLMGDLYRRGMTIGREHIASLINTLFLAYAGIALPTILYLTAFQSKIPLWLTINGEPIAEEIVRTMVGSIGIILAVPITTLLAAWAFKGKSTSRSQPALFEEPELPEVKEE